MTLNDKANNTTAQKKAKWAKIWQIIRDIILALLSTETITEIIKS